MKLKVERILYEVFSNVLGTQLFFFAAVYFPTQGFKEADTCAYEHRRTCK
jgi:hypothetical protein